ncbi:uncharacterized protein LOC113397510 isoform X3 [Vanessa tameamea]|uniref:Uncharacterized protein LOC113397510 isoform X3 n=1 Tax=Vanessa tameamea TaxID=334116 RepID=A0ABM4ARL5_VANTA
MKIFVLLVFIAVLSDQICAYPAADDAIKDAVKDASTAAPDVVKDKNPVKDIFNPADMMSKGKDLMDTLMKPISSPLNGVVSMLKPHDPPSSDAVSKSASKAESKNPAISLGSTLFGSFFG